MLPCRIDLYEIQGAAARRSDTCGRRWRAVLGAALGGEPTSLPVTRSIAVAPPSWASPTGLPNSRGALQVCIDVRSNACDPNLKKSQLFMQPLVQDLRCQLSVCHGGICVLTYAAM